MRTISISVVALGAAVLCTPAAAQGFWHMISHSGEAVIPSKSMTVSYTDLDVSQEAGAKVLLSRIQASAKKVCGPAPSSAIDFRDKTIYQKCVQTAIDQAVAGSNQALLMNLHGGAHGTTGATK
ncbi:MAG: UrcA family protein [Alphaproteobacteria bacterium]